MGIKHQHKWEYSMTLLGWKCSCGMATFDRETMIPFDEAFELIKAEERGDPYAHGGTLS